MAETSQMSMNRVIHAAVRRDLARLEDALETFPDGDGDRAHDLVRAHGYLCAELTRHHQHEDTLIWPMLAGFGVDPALLGAMESEHHAMADALRDSVAALDRLALAPTAATARDVRRTVSATREVVDQHLAHEERELEPVLEGYLDSPEWRAVEKKLRKAPPAVAGAFFAWIQDGMDDEGRAYLHQTVPTPVTFVLGGVFGRGYRRDVAAVWHG